jgi:thiosulfate dehydrogenase [quinone] large subunit
VSTDKEEQVMRKLDRIKNPKVLGVGWLLARVWIGWTFLEAGLGKVTGDRKEAWIGSEAGAGVTGYLTRALTMAPGGEAAKANPEVTGWYAGLVRQVFLPNADLFGYLVAFGEVLVGAALILGILTRFSAAMGLVMSFAYLFAGTSGDNPLMVLLGLPMVLVGGAAAGYYGIDRYLLPFLRERRARGEGMQRRGRAEAAAAGD